MVYMRFLVLHVKKKHTCPGLCQVRSVSENIFINNNNKISNEINNQLEMVRMRILDIDSSNPDALHAFVEKYLPPKELEKKKFGEVFTPLKLVREMLDAIEKYADKNFWKNPNMKILDPAAGIGNFPLIAFEKLMMGLKDVIKEEGKRKKHILENMLYMVELNKVNVHLMKKIFNGDKYNLNIICGDFLSDGVQKAVKTKWKVEAYDLVMGNPPYQDFVDGKRKGGYGGKQPLWEKFVNDIVDMERIKKEGYLVFIHPLQKPY